MRGAFDSISAIKILDFFDLAWSYGRVKTRPFIFLSGARAHPGPVQRLPYTGIG